MNKTLLQRWPLYAAVIVLLLLVWLVTSVSISHNRGLLIYALDDAYIHMAMAKNLSQFGVWGVTRYGFTPTSSSILWTLLLGLTYYLGGVHQIVPLLWNVIFAIVVLIVADAILGWYKVAPVVRFAALVAIIFIVPLPVLVLSGMEQILQTAIALPAVFLAARLVSGESPGTARRDWLTLLVLAPLLTAVRFEGMFLIVLIAGLLLFIRRWGYALAFAACGYVPVAVNGIVSLSKGWFWFPTSVLLKASLPSFLSPAALLLSIVTPIYLNFRGGLHMMALMISVVLVYLAASSRGSGARESRQIVGAVLFFAGLAHLAFVGEGPLYRYDAWWCALATLFIAVQLPVIAPGLLSPPVLSTWAVPGNFARLALVLLLAFPLGFKGTQLLWFVPQCTTNIFEQQYQMASFVQRYYSNSAIALNDIGAVNFFANIRCFDMWGLASAEVAAARRKQAYNVGVIDRLAKQSGTRIAIIYDDWFTGMIPKAWIRVGRWTIQNNVVAGKDTVSFYAVSPEEAVYLSQSLENFSNRLPADVIQQGH